eukprot:Seg229.14 transcript_id=Seg229.14/GoldUCD/mRNA.D3Y31 product="putative protein L388" protein_id=Seg229.14/GoldUCD/D3Y31
MFSTDLAKYKPKGSFLGLMTYNVRYDNPNDGADSWQHRKGEVVKFLEAVNPCIFGLQEALDHQVNDVKKGLPSYEHVGVGRDGSKHGEYNPIFYNTRQTKLLDSSTFWLSKTPDVVGSRFEGASLPRICTWGRFRGLDSEYSDLGEFISFYVLNTHLDHQHSSIRKKQTSVIHNFIQNSIPEGVPAVLMGDFNAARSEECISEVSAILKDTSQTASIIKEASEFTGFDGKSNETIDYMFYRGFNAHLYAVLKDTRENGRFLSDHRPVYSMFTPEI